VADAMPHPNPLLPGKVAYTYCAAIADRDLRHMHRKYPLHKPSGTAHNRWETCPCFVMFQPVWSQKSFRDRYSTPFSPGDESFPPPCLFQIYVVSRAGHPLLFSRFANG